MTMPVVRPSIDSNAPETTSAAVTFSDEQKQLISMQQEIESLKGKNNLLDKQLRLTEAISRVGFRDNSAVRKLVQGQVEFDQEHGTWSCRSESGKVYHSLSVFLEDYAAENPFLAGLPTNQTSSSNSAVPAKKMSDVEKSRYIREYGMEAYLQLPKTSRVG